MFSNPHKTFTIHLPSSTDKDVVSWFERMDGENRLCEELIHLVYTSIQQSHTLTAGNSNDKDSYYTENSQSSFSLGEEDFFHSLYNWQDAASDIFKEEETIEKTKIKKKMLSV